MYLYFDQYLEGWVLASKSCGVVAAANGVCDHPGMYVVERSCMEVYNMYVSICEGVH